MKSHKKTRILGSAARLIPAVAALLAGLAEPTPTAAAVPPGWDLQPGVPIYVVNNDTDIQSECTLGWFFKTPDGDVQAITAGHCRTGPEILINDQLNGGRVHAGTWTSSQYSGDETILNGNDIATVALSPDLGRNASARGGVDPVGVSSAQTLANDPPARICKRGNATGVSCGPMVSVSDERVAFRAAVDHGDSGGPVWAVSGRGVVTAVAIVAGQADSDPGITVGQLINPWLLRWGAKLGIPQP